MYGFFLAATVLNFVLIFLSPLVIRTRWYTLGLAFLGAIAGLLVTVAAIIATVISIAASIALTAQDELNIRCDIGVPMFAFMWIAAICTDVAFLLHSALGCCCRPQRGNRSPAVSGSASPALSSEREKATPYQLPSFVRRRKGANTAEEPLRT